MKMITPNASLADVPQYGPSRRVMATSAAVHDPKASPVVKFLLGGSVAWTYEFVLGQYVLRNTHTRYN